MDKTVAILGASDRPNRFSHRAQTLLREKGYTPLPVNPRLKVVDGVRCYPGLHAIGQQIDTITVYVRSEILIGLVDEIIEARPQRVILNPGSESGAVVELLQQAGIAVQMACTLILLDTGQF